MKHSNESALNHFLGPNGAWFELIDDKLLFIAVVVEDSDTFSLKPNYSPFSLTFSIVLGWVNYTQAIATTGDDNLIFFGISFSHI